MAKRDTMSHSSVERGTIDLNDPLRLSVAASLAFPDGSMTASGLRREAARGRLIIEHIAGKYFTTLANIQRMRELCRKEQKASDSGLGRRAEAKQAVSSVTLSGSSLMVENISQRDALRAKLQKQKQNLRLTSRLNTSREEPGRT